MKIVAEVLKKLFKEGPYLFLCIAVLAFMLFFVLRRVTFVRKQHESFEKFVKMPLLRLQQKSIQIPSIKHASFCFRVRVLSEQAILLIKKQVI